jgi:putative ABC transport system permease protein
MTGPIRGGVRRLFHLGVRRRETIDAEMDEELRLHLEARTEQFIRSGMTPADAHAEARRRLGTSVDHTRDQLRRSAQLKERRMAMRERIDDLMHDVRYAARGLIQHPAFTIIAVLTLAVGIGANTAIFSAVDALLLRALPFRDPATLMDIVQRSPFDPAHGGSGDAPWSYPKFMTFRDAQRSYTSLALDTRENFILTGASPDRIIGELVSAQFLTTLGASVALGHDFPADEDSHPGAAKLAIISNALWQRRFQADPNVIGRLLRVDSSSYQVIGVLPSAFRGMSGKAEILLPLTALSADDLGPWDFEYSLVGRLKPGVTAAQAAADARRVAPLVYQATPQDKNSISSGPGGAWDAAARPLNSVRVASTMRRSLLVLFGAVGMVLLIACVNLANLLLGRAAARRQEIAIRLAIGAGRARLVRLLLCESLMLAVLGGTAGMVVAAWGTHLLRALNPEEILQVQGLAGSVGVVGFETVHLDARALAFTFVVTVIVGVVFGLVPALQATRADLTENLKEGSTGAGHGARLGGSRRTLVVVEVALALILLAGSGLMLRSLANVLAIDPGFTADHLLTLRLTVPVGAVPNDSMPGFYDQLQARLAAVPGVAQVAMIDCPPLNGGCNGTLMTFPDRPASATGNAIVGVHWATPTWFSAVHVPLRHGRMFTAADRTGAPRVVLIGETAAKRYWPNEDPLGKRVKVYQGGFDAGATVIGIVGDVRFQTIDSLPGPDVYIAYAQAYTSRMMVFLRTTGDPLALVGGVRRALRESAPQDPVYDIATMADRVGAASSQARFSAILLAMFAAVALALAVMGIYGVMSFGVAQRTREIGIRIALGADRQRVLRMIVREGAALATIGTAIGLIAALALTRILRTLLFEVTPTDPMTYLVIVAVVAGAALAASWFPARQAARVEPTEALRRG